LGPAADAPTSVPNKLPYKWKLDVVVNSAALSTGQTGHCPGAQENEGPWPAGTAGPKIQNVEQLKDEYLKLSTK